MVGNQLHYQISAMQAEIVAIASCALLASTNAATILFVLIEITVVKVHGTIGLCFDGKSLLMLRANRNVVLITLTIKWILKPMITHLGKLLGL